MSSLELETGFLLVGAASTHPLVIVQCTSEQSFLTGTLPGKCKYRTQYQLPPSEHLVKKPTRLSRPSQTSKAGKRLGIFKEQVINYTFV